MQAPGRGVDFVKGTVVRAEVQTVFAVVIERLALHWPERQLLVVGDARQAINAYKGARAEFLTRCEALFVNGRPWTVCSLSTSYRLTREKLEAERKVLEATGIQEYNRLVAGTLTDLTLQYKGIEATLELAKSTNSKVIVIGGPNGLPIILNPDGSVAAQSAGVAR